LRDWVRSTLNLRPVCAPQWQPVFKNETRQRNVMLEGEER
jgi:prolyl-tRNA synthetase